MKRVPEAYLIIGWIIYFFGEAFLLRWIITGGWALSAHFPGSQFMQHASVLSGFAAHLLAAYLLFRLIVKYLVRKSKDAATPAI